MITAKFIQAKVNINFNTQPLQTSTGTPVARIYVERPLYEGPVEVTPSENTQILETNNFRMGDNITINPIPSNYGLITWNGAFITVS